VSSWSDVGTLEGSLVRLEALHQRHATDLAEAAEEQREAYGYTQVPRAAEVPDYISAHLERRESGMMAPFTQVRRSDERAVGVTAFWDPRWWPERSELAAIMIGWTWLAASAQRTGINIESKLLLMRYAFERLGVARLDLATDARNEQSRRAIVGLGATFEGVLRQWSDSRAPGEEGMLRDTAMFSVIASEWPRVEARLQGRLRSRSTA
jgi:RimJ/RimL family protein N-acetyltransferase